MTDHPVRWPPPTADAPLAVLASGGLDSAILLGEALRSYPAVHPLYIRTGAAWEATEFQYLQRFLKAMASPKFRPTVELALPASDLYGNHWSITGVNVPDADSPDEAVELPGRNVILLSKALLWCHLNGVPQLATAPLGSNPFPDATPEFYDGFASIVGRAVGKPPVAVLRPYADANLHKADVLKRGAGMPLALTFSCIRPRIGAHCGACNKCAERRRGFAEAGMVDPTEYAN
jgi:7-cyano-7-deazaguanine synthase